MTRFPCAHATHPQWGMAAALVLAQLRAQMVLPGHAHNPTLALLYITDHYAEHAADILEHLSAELPAVTDWSGTVGIGIAASGVEYFDEPALAVMLVDLLADQYRVFSGVAPLGLGFAAQTALVHADANTPELAELVREMAGRTDGDYLFGGVASSRGSSLQFAVAGDGNLRGYGAANGVFQGGLSGVAFGEQVQLISRVTQGCKPVAKPRTITKADHNLVLELDGEPALDVLQQDLGITLERPQEALEALRATLVGLGAPTSKSEYGARPPVGNFGSDVTVRHIIGLDPGRYGIAVADYVQAGMQLTFCRRNVQAARADLTRICAEIREELEPEEMLMDLPSSSAPLDTEPQQGARQIAGAIYVSCTGRGGPHFGGPNAELEIVQRALGDVPLVGFFAGGEIAHSHLYGYTGVLTVFTSDAAD